MFDQCKKYGVRGWINKERINYNFNTEYGVNGIKRHKTSQKSKKEVENEEMYYLREILNCS